MSDHGDRTPRLPRGIRLTTAIAGFALMASALTIGDAAEDRNAGGDQLEFRYFGLSAPNGRVLRGDSFSLDLSTGLASAIAAPIARHNIFCAAYSASLSPEDKRSIRRIAAQARRLAVNRIEILSDPDGAAARRNDGYVCASAVRLAFAEQDLPKGAAIDINTASGVGQPVQAKNSALLVSARRVEVLLYQPR